MAKKFPRFVLDCSIAFAWFFADEQNDYADAIGLLFPKAQALVPELWPLEVANVLLVGERRKRCTQTQAARWLKDLAILPIVVDSQTNRRAWTDILPLARSENLSAYDAAYLELAIRENVPLATLDKKLKTVSSALGIQELKP